LSGLYPQTLDDVLHQFHLPFFGHKILGHLLWRLPDIVHKRQDDDMESRWLVLTTIRGKGLRLECQYRSQANKIRPQRVHYVCTIAHLGNEAAELWVCIGSESAESKGMSIEFHAGLQEGSKGTRTACVGLLIGISI
jgi:hypothetical protein